MIIIKQEEVLRQKEWCVALGSGREGRYVNKVVCTVTESRVWGWGRSGNANGRADRLINMVGHRVAKLATKKK